MRIELEQRSEVTTIYEYEIDEQRFVDFCRDNEIEEVTDEVINLFIENENLRCTNTYEDTNYTLESGFYESDINALEELINENLDY